MSELPSQLQPMVKQEQEGSGTPSMPAAAPPPAPTVNLGGAEQADIEEEYDPARPDFPSSASAASAQAGYAGGGFSSHPPPPPPPPPPPQSTFRPPPPGIVPNFAGLPPHLLGLGPPPPPPPPGFLGQFRPPPPNPFGFAMPPPSLLPLGGFPPPPPLPSLSAPTAVSPASTSTLIGGSIPGGHKAAAGPKARQTKPIPSGPRAQNAPRGPKGRKPPRSANISDNLRRALYQDEKYILHAPVWKVVGGQMTRLHLVETSPSNLPITKVIATSKLEAISLHARLLEKATTSAIFYSDGSMKNGWAWGAAVEWVRIDGTARGKVGTKLREELGQCDPTDAEMGGVRKALEAYSMVATLDKSELIVFTDSQAAITLIDSGIRYQSQLFMSTLERTLTLHPNVKVTLVWVPGHVGIAGNELADRTAVSGSTTSFLARRAGRLPGVSDGGGDVPVLLSRKVPASGAEEGAEAGELVAGEGEQARPLDDSLTAPEGSLFVARFPEAATANDLEVLFGQFGKLASIDMFSIPPVANRFALLAFEDPSVVGEAIQWLDDQPVTLPTRYAEGRDCEVWKGWQGSLKVARNEVGRLVPSSVAGLFKGLPRWATTKAEERGPEEHEPTEEELAEDEDDDIEIVPHSGHGDRTHGGPGGPVTRPGRDSLPHQQVSTASPSAYPTSVAPTAPHYSAAVAARGRSVSATPSADPSHGAPAVPQKRYEDMTPSERFLLTYEGFGPGPGNKATAVAPSGGPTEGGDRKRRRRSRDHLPPVPVSTLTGQPYPMAPAEAIQTSPGSNHYPHRPSVPPHGPAGYHADISASPEVRAASVAAPAHFSGPPSSFASGLPVHVASSSNGAGHHQPGAGGDEDSALPTSIAEMARLILDLQADNTYLDAQHSRLTIVTREPADWSLALAALAKSILREQEALETARRQRAKAEDAVADWENVLQRNNVGIEERRGFVLDVLDVLDASVMEDTSIIGKLRQQIEVKSASLRQRMALLPPTTAQIVQSCEDIFTTLNRALEEQKAALDESERRSSVLGGLVAIRRDAKGSWRGRREEIDLVVQQLTGPLPPPTAPAAMRY